jgi:hypothetical protein
VIYNNHHQSEYIQAILHYSIDSRVYSVNIPLYYKPELQQLYPMHLADIPISPSIYGMDNVNLYDNIGMTEAPFPYNPECNDRQNADETEASNANEESNAEQDSSSYDNGSQTKGLPVKCSERE